MIMAAGLAALFVGGFLALVSIVLVTSSAKKLKALNPAPEKTIQTLQENVQWAKNQIK
jgi:Putative Actinobacterial Holin-X, holin superfamily III